MRKLFKTKKIFALLLIVCCVISILNPSSVRAVSYNQIEVNEYDPDTGSISNENSSQEQSVTSNASSETVASTEEEIENDYIDRHDLIQPFSTTYAEVVDNSSLMEDTGIRIKDQYVSVNVTLKGNLKWTVKDFKDVAKQNMIVSTNSDGFFTSSDKITIDYKNVGTYKGKTIGIRTVLYPATLTSTEKSIFKTYGEASSANGSPLNLSVNYSCVFLEDTHVYAYKDKANFYHGIRYANAPRMQVSYEMYYSSTGENINADMMYFTWGSLNMGEGISSNNAYTNYYKQNGAYPALYSLNKGITVGNIKFASSLSVSNQGYINSIGEEYYYYSTPYNFLANTTSNTFTDKVSGADFWKSAGTMLVASDDGIYRFRMLSKSFWFVPMLGPVGATAPAPVKYITEGTSTAKSVERKAGETVEFNISQNVEILGYTGSGYMKYSNFGLYDTLQSGLDYKSAKVVRVYNGATTDVTSNGTLKYDSTTRKVSFSFNSNYLSNSMLYKGETYILKITCTVRSDAPTKINNHGYSVICNDAQTTNVVTVNHPLYTITTEVINGTIKESISNIEKGSNKSVSYTPDSGHYLKQVLVDGANVSITTYKSNYSFSNITDNHTIKVVYAKNPVITITKNVDLNTVVWEKGSPTFCFKITGTDYLGKTRTYYRVIDFDKTSSNSKSVTMKIPAGTYTVSESPINDYTLSSVTAGTSCTVSGNQAELSTINSDTADCTFTNEVSSYADYTENDFVINKLK